MDELSKKRELQKVPSRSLLAAMKKQMRREIKASASPRKPLKKK